MGRNIGQPVSQAYTAPYPFTGGVIAKAVVDVSVRPTSTGNVNWRPRSHGTDVSAD